MVAKIFKPEFPHTLTLRVHGVEQEEQRTLLDLRGHTDSVNSVCFSPDGLQIVSGSSDGTIRIWDALTGDEVMKAFEVASGILSVSFSPNGKHIALGSSDGRIRVLKLSQGKDIIQLLSIKGHTEVVTSVAFSPDGKHIASGSEDKTVRVWNAKTGEEILEGMVGHSDIRSVCFTPSGNHIGSCSFGPIQMWDAKTGKQIWTSRVTGIRCFGFSPDGRHIITASPLNRLLLWNWSSGDGIIKKFACPEQGFLLSIAFSPDGAYIVSGSTDKTLRMWNVKTGKEVVKPFEGHMSHVMSVSFSPDGTQIISGSADNSIRVWNAGLTTVVKSNRAHISSVAFSPDGTYIVSGLHDNTMRMWDSKTGEEIMKKYVSGLLLVEVSPDSSCIISGSYDCCVKVWDVWSDKEIMTLWLAPDIQPANSTIDSIICIGFLSDGTHIYAGTTYGNICIWDVNTGKEVLKCKHLDGVIKIQSLCFSPAGNFIASMSSSLQGSVISCWSAVRPSDMVKRLYQPYFCNTTTSICFSSDESQAAASMASSIVILDVVTWQIIQTMECSFDVTSICFFPDRRCLVSGSRDGKIRIWIVRTGSLMKSLEGHTAAIHSVGVSADGSQILSGSEDKTIRMWNMKLAERPQLYILPGITPAKFTFSLDYQNDQAVTMLDPCCIALSWDDMKYHDGDKGWITGPEGELILWILPEYRKYLVLPPCTLMIGTLQVSFDLNQFVHGIEWAKCRSQTL